MDGHCLAKLRFVFLLLLDLRRRRSLTKILYRYNVQDLLVCENFGSVGGGVGENGKVGLNCLCLHRKGRGVFRRP